MADEQKPMSASDAERMLSQSQSTVTPNALTVPASFNPAARIRVELFSDESTDLGIAITSEIGTVGIRLTMEEAIKFAEELRRRIGLPK